jgi:hypothetical protein
VTHGLKLLSFESFPASILQNRDLSFKPFLFFYRTLLYLSFELHNLKGTLSLKGTNLKGTVLFLIRTVPFSFKRSPFPPDSSNIKDLQRPALHLQGFVEC